MKSPKKNVAESVRARLLNLSKERGDEFQLTLADYAIERFLYRLGQSPLRDRFVLKGAVLFRVWMGQTIVPPRISISSEGILLNYRRSPTRFAKSA